jgi:8-oxo-dGTP diphosphatase
MLTSLVLLRHALAGDSGRWGDDDHHRPLELSGLAQSLLMVSLLEGIPVDRILSSPYARCHHSVAAVAAARRLPVESAPWLGSNCRNGRMADGVAALTGRLLLCTHGECVEPLMAALADHYPLPPGPPTELAKGEALHLTFAEGQAQIRRIGVPPVDRAQEALRFLGVASPERV